MLQSEKDRFLYFGSELFLRYQREYHSSIDFEDISVVAEVDSEVGGLRLTLHTDKNGETTLGCYGGPVRYFGSTNRSVQQLLADYVKETLTTRSVAQFHYVDYLQDGKLSRLSEVLLERGASVSPCFVGYVDLNRTLEEIRLAVRRRYRSYLTVNEQTGSCRVYQSEDLSDELWNKCIDLHLKCAGRKTRAKETWDVQLQQIRRDETFLVVREEMHEVIAFGIFPIYREICLYGVSAGLGGPLKKPTTHAVIWKAIRYAREKGCKRFEIGETLYAQDERKAEKEKAISFFKRGFTTDTRVELHLTLAQNS